jgi:integrase
LVHYFKQKGPTHINKSLEKDQYLTKSEIHKILNYCQSSKNKNNHAIASIIECLLYTGCRISELIQAKLTDLKRVEDVYHLNIVGKGNKSRIVYLPIETMDRLNRVIDSTEYLLESRTGDPFTQPNIYQRLRRISIKVLNKKIHPHGLRHSCAMALIKSGMSIRSVSEYLGHSNVSTTLSYYDHSKPDPKSVINAMENIHL